MSQDAVKKSDDDGVVGAAFFIFDGNIAACAKRREWLGNDLFCFAAESVMHPFEWRYRTLDIDTLPHLR